jgi:hypothetical protein
MQQVDESGFFNPEAGGDFGLGQCAVGQPQVQEGSPFRLAHPERLKPFVQLQAPGERRAMKQRREGFRISFAQGTNSLAC